MSYDVEKMVYRRTGNAVFKKTKEVFGGLSNMAGGYPLVVNGVTFRTAEALYQACKFPHNSAIQKEIVEQKSPMTAAMIGRAQPENTIRLDWDMVRTAVMHWVIRVKYYQYRTRVTALLQSTSGMDIIEESSKDAFWGAKPEGEEKLVGMNVLGKLWMELRDEPNDAPYDLPEISDFLLYGELIRRD